MSSRVVEQDVRTRKGERLASGTVISFFSIAIARVATIATSIVIVRALGPRELGLYYLVTLAISVGSVCAAFGVPPALVKFLAETPRDRATEAEDLIGAGSVLTFVSTFLTTLAVALVAPILAVALYGEPRFGALLLVALGSLAVGSALGPFLPIFQARELIRELGMRNMATALASVPVTVLLVILWGLEGAVWAMVVSSLLAACLNAGLLRRVWREEHLRLRLPRNRAAYRRIMSYALPAFAAALLVTPVLWLGNTLLMTHSSFADVGLYSVAFGLASYLLFIPSAVGVPFVPMVSKLHRASPEDFPPLLLKTLRVSVFVLLPPAAILIAFPDFLLQLLYGPDFARASALVRILAPAVFLSGVCGIVGHGIAGTGRMWHGLGLNFLWASVLLLGSLALVPSLLGLGLAATYLAAYSILFLASLAYLWRIWYASLRDLAGPVSIAAASMVAIYVVSSADTVPMRGPILVGMIAVTVLVELLAMSRREVEVLVSPIRKWLS